MSKDKPSWKAFLPWTEEHKKLKQDEKEASDEELKEPEKPEAAPEEEEGYGWKAFFPWTEEGKAMREQRKREKELEEEDEEFDLEKYLQKAGFDISEEDAKKRMFEATVGLMGLLTLIIILISMQGTRGPANLLIFMSGFWTAGFAFMLALVSFTFVLYLDLRMYRRTKEVEEVLPDFLQLASSNISAGMPLDRALWFAVRPQFGILGEEIEEVAKATYAGKDLNEALRIFAEKYDSQQLERAVSLIIEGMSAGGEMADLLNKISMNIEEANILKQEMAANVTTYVIFIGMATLVGAPFLFGLATQLLQVIQGIAGNLGGATSSASAGGLFAFDINAHAVSLSDFKIYSSSMLIVSSFFSGAIISVIRKGNIKEGAVLIPSFIVTTLVLYQIANALLGGLMSTFI